MSIRIAQRLTIGCAAVALATAAPGCGNGGLEPLQDPPPMESLGFWSQVYYGVTPPEGVVWIDGLAADPGFHASHASDFPLEVRTSSGDIEVASLRRAICGPNREDHVWSCDKIGVSMRDGHSVLDLYEHAKAMDARLVNVSPLLITAGVQLFGTSLDEAVRRAKAWPGVRDADYEGIAFLGIENPPPHEIIARALKASIKLDVASPIVGNGILEAMHGDTITARYEQRDGSVLTRSWVFRGPPE